MEPVIMQIIVILAGVALLLSDFFAFVYRKLTEGICLCWCFCALVFIALGAVPGLSAWAHLLSLELFLAVAVFGALLLGMAFYLSCAVSQLIRKNQELAMHVSLLNQENESILNKLKELQKHEDTVCH